MKNKVIFSVFSFIIVANLYAQQPNNKSYVITLATLSNYNGDLSWFKPIFKFGNVFVQSYENGTTKVFLQRLDKTNFKTRSDAEKICKEIRKYQKYKKSYVSEVESNSFFNSPRLELKEKELVITVKLNQEEPLINNPIDYSDKYWIQLGCFSQEKSKEDLQKMFRLQVTDRIEIRDGGNCRKYWIGFYNSQIEAQKKMDEVSKFGKCKLVIEKWNKATNKFEQIE